MAVSNAMAEAASRFLWLPATGLSPAGYNTAAAIIGHELFAHHYATGHAPAVR